MKTVSNPRRILVCPLNWGLGHAARDVPVIKRLLDLNHEVVIAGDGGGLELLRTEFPGLESVDFRSFVRVRYSRVLPAWLKITLLSPLLSLEIFSEHLRIRRIIKDIRPDVLISDNRYGLWNRRLTCILITHQLHIRLPRGIRLLEYPLNLVTRAFIGKFDRCWIPDYPGQANLSGELSHPQSLPRNSVYIGAISRMEREPAAHPGGRTGKKADPETLVILLSGPEPQRSLLQKIVLKQVLSLNSRCVIVQGLPGSSRRTDLTSTATMYSHLQAAELGVLLREAEYVICRAGYTGIMDLALLKKKAMIIPTPGQTEQEYLAEYLSEKGFFLSCRQDDLDLRSALEELAGFEPGFNLPADDLLEKEITTVPGL